MKLQAVVCWPRPYFQSIYIIGSTEFWKFRHLKEGYAYD